MYGVMVRIWCGPIGKCLIQLMTQTIIVSTFIKPNGLMLGVAGGTHLFARYPRVSPISLQDTLG